MENLNPTWMAISQIRLKMALGQSIRTATLETCKGQHDPFLKTLYSWAQSHFNQPCQGFQLTEAQQALIHLLKEGFSGKPIYEPLGLLEEDVRGALLAEIEEHVAKLPFYSLIPLLFFIGPSLFIALVGPLLSALLKEISS